MGIFCFSDPKEKIFDYLYSDMDGYDVCRLARRKLSEEENDHLIYGELAFKGLKSVYKSRRLLDKINSSKVFYDLGSGSGKVIIASDILLPNIERFVGVELLTELYDTSNRAKDYYYSIDQVRAEKIQFINENFFNVDYSEADIIFLHYPIKNSEELYLKLENKFSKELKKGTIIISGIRELHNIEKFPLVDKVKALTSYGKTILFCHIKV